MCLSVASLQLMDNGAYGSNGPRAQQLVVLVLKHEPENATIHSRCMGDIYALATVHNTDHALTGHVQASDRQYLVFIASELASNFFI